MFSLSKVTAPNILRAGIVSYLRTVGLYSGPETATSGSEDAKFTSDWQSQKRKLIHKKVKLLGQGYDVENDSSLIDENILKVNELPHHIMAEDPKKYFQVQHSSDYFNITGSNLSETPEKSFLMMNNADPDFSKPEVQEILKRITGKNMEKIYARKTGKHTEMPRMRLLTSQQLEEEIKKKEKEAESLLKMPPVMLEREEIDDVLAHDEYLDGYEDCNVAFVDISEDIPKNERFMVVREPTGLLRKAKWNERDRYQQVYFPIEGRHIIKPWLFSDLSTALENNLHLNVMEQIVVELEPDSAEYIDLVQQVYDDVNNRTLFPELKSTRFFGGLAFFLTKHRTPDNLISHMLENAQIYDAADVARLFYIVHQSVSNEDSFENDGSEDSAIKIVQHYIFNNASDQKGLQLALDTCKLNLL